MSDETRQRIDEIIAAALRRRARAERADPPATPEPVAPSQP